MRSNAGFTSISRASSIWLMAMMSGEEAKTLKNFCSELRSACSKRWLSIALATMSATVRNSRMSSSDHACCVFTRSRPRLPEIWPPTLSGTITSERISCTSRMVRTACASAGSSATFGTWNTLPANSVFQAQASSRTESSCNRPICGVTPSAHHSWVLLKRSPSSQMRRT